MDKMSFPELIRLDLKDILPHRDILSHDELVLITQKAHLLHMLR